ncbi:MAG: D-alanyl-D-alanine carboxypeptidase [Actinobacteria bacterium]|jgi:D-alanyl-D-alanine carboxypeptidase|nr:D-alanyl-D-alanine carboxypeptidase [Actinomycetota bacterium]
MKPLTTGWGRLYPFVAFLALLAVMASVLAGAAQGSTTTTALEPVEREATSLTVHARDLGDFPGAAPSIQSPSAIVVNTSSGRVLYEKNAAERRPMASTTKIMTAVLVLERMDMAGSVSISEKAAATIETKPWLKAGDELTVEELLYSLLVHSANSAAVALAEACSGDVETFVAEMNVKAAELGMQDTSFMNPNGLDKQGHYSTVADLAVLACYAMQNRVFRTMVATKEYTLSLPGRDAPMIFENTNKLLGKSDWVDGIKTGLTPKAKQCLVASGMKDGVSAISVILGQPSSNVCWEESQALLEYGLSQYRHVTLIGKGVPVAEATIPYRVDERLRLITANAVELELYKDDSVTASVTLDEALALPVTAGEPFGVITLSVEGEEVGSVDLVADRSFSRATLGAKIVYYFQRLGRWIGG